MSDIVPQKPCSKCKQSLPATPEFWHKDKKGKYGLSSTCKECAKTKSLKWHYDNQEYANQRSSEWHATHLDEVAVYRAENAEKIAQQKREWRQNNPEKVSAQKRRHAKRHQSKINTYHRKWYTRNRNRIIDGITPEQRAEASKRSCAWAKANPERVLNYAHKRRAWKYGNGGDGYTKEDKALQLRSQKGLCWWCSIPMGNDITEDHIVPLSKGGRHDPRNIVLAHMSCNCSKKDNLPQNWIGRLF